MRFENCYVMTEALLREFQAVYLFRRKISYFCIGIMGLGWLLALLSIALSWEMDAFTKGFLLLALPVWLLLCWGKIWYTSRLQSQQNRELSNGQDPQLRLTVSNAEEIVLFNPATGGTQYLRFSQVIRVLESKNLYILILKPKLGILFKKDAFIGEADGFLDCIYSWCPQVRKN